MLIRMAMKLSQLSPWFRKRVWRQWYQYLAGYQVADWRFMNYGYSALDAAEPQLILQADDEPDRYAIQLYHRVAGAIDLKGREVLEIGSGRGGGSSFVKRYHHPSHMTGVDISAKAIQFCREHHRIDELSFLQGDAEALPLGDHAFDAVFNVESSHCYGSMPVFLREVNRVLRPGGHFLFADFRATSELGQLQAQLAGSGMAILEHQDITPQVLAALRQDSARKLAMIKGRVSQPLIGTFRQFAGIEGSDIYAGFQSGTVGYVRYVLQKQLSA
jgi:ubiquinone/menaquinone biosynthesis C-methylase UbiE